MIGGNRLTNEEAYLLQKFARTVLKTNNIDHHRTADHVAFAQAMAGLARTEQGRGASLRDTLTAKQVLVVGGDPTQQSPADGLESADECSEQRCEALCREYGRDQAAAAG